MTVERNYGGYFYVGISDLLCKLCTSISIYVCLPHLSIPSHDWQLQNMLEDPEHPTTFSRLDWLLRRTTCMLAFFGFRSLAVRA